MKMTAQSDQIAQLTSEVDTLKTSLGSQETKSKEDRIKELEKELAGLRG
jgi:hypothetical protein